MSYIKQLIQNINYYKDYIQINKYEGTIVISYIIKTKEYDAYNIQLIHNNKSIF